MPFTITKGTEHKGHLIIADKINEFYNNGEFGLFLAYGKSGFGKTTYATKALMEVNPGITPEEMKPLFIFKPQELIEFSRRLQNQDRREKVIIIDDAGLWFANSSFHDPFVQAAVKYFQVIRTQCAAVILTSPSLSLLVRSLRTTDMYTINIRKERKSRIAMGYSLSNMPNGKTFIRRVWEDRFIPRMPDDVYAWYYPKRKMYVDEAKKQMEDGLREKQMKKELLAAKYEKLKKTGEYSDYVGMD